MKPTCHDASKLVSYSDNATSLYSKGPSVREAPTLFERGKCTTALKIWIGIDNDCEDG